MARRVLADIDAEVLQRLGNRTDITATQRGFFIQDAYLLIAKGFAHKELQGSTTDTIAQGDDTLTPVVTDLWWPTQIKDTTNGVIIRPEDIEVIDGIQTKVSGAPRSFYWWGGVFTFDTLANEDIDVSVKYHVKPVEITSGQSSTLDQIYDQLIILKAAQVGLETARDFEGATEIAKLYRAYIQEHGLIPVYEEKKNDYRNTVKVRMR